MGLSLSACYLFSTCPSYFCSSYLDIFWLFFLIFPFMWRIASATASSWPSLMTSPGWTPLSIQEPNEKHILKRCCSTPHTELKTQTSWLPLPTKDWLRRGWRGSGKGSLWRRGHGWLGQLWL